MLERGFWLGIDIGSSRQKVATFCAIDSTGTSSGDSSEATSVDFEQGPAGSDYPAINTRETMLDTSRETYLKADVEAAIADVLENAALVERARRCLASGLPVSVALDAPVYFSLDGRQRATERASSPTFTTPTREIFERDLVEKEKEGFFRSVVYWKCVGFAVYRQIAALLTGEPAPGLETLAAWTGGDGDDERRWRLREVFPSDVYKRANGTDGVLADAPRRVLAHLLEAPWQAAEKAAGQRAVRSTSTLKRLGRRRSELARELEAGGRLESFEKAAGTFGDLFDAFTAAYAACCEDHDGAVMHGADEPESLRREGAIMTVAVHSGPSRRDKVP